MTMTRIPGERLNTRNITWCWMPLLTNESMDWGRIRSIGWNVFPGSMIDHKLKLKDFGLKDRC